MTVMFNFAIFKKTFGETFWSLAIASIGMVTFVVLFVWAMLNMGTELLNFVSKFAFIAKIFKMGFGVDVSGDVSLTILFAVCFTHAVVLSLTWAVIITTATRSTAGEIERGTADMLLTLPVSRPEVYFSTSLVWILAAAILSCGPLLGVWIALQIFEMTEPVAITRFFAPTFNFFCLNLAIGGISSMTASCVNRRGLAIGIVVGVAFVSVALTFLEPFIEPIKPIRFLSLLNYFRPVDVVRSGVWPLSQMLTMVAVGVVTWLVGMVVFARKDIPTA